MKQAILTLDGVGKVVGTRWILKGISFTFEEGGRYLLLGPNGSGKTTLLKTLATLVRPTTGRLLFRGEEVGEQREAFLRKVSFISHGEHLYEELTGLQNLEFFARLYDVEDPGRRAQELLERVGLKLFGHERVREYSQGMKRRLTLAKAILHDPDVILFDEPYSGLDLQGATLLDGILEESARRPPGLLVLTSHQPELCWRFAERYLYLEEGRLVSCGGMECFQTERIEQRLRRDRMVGVL